MSAKLHAIWEKNDAYNEALDASDKILRVVDTLLEIEDTEARVAQSKATLETLNEEIAACHHEIKRVGQIDHDVHLSMRLSEVLQTTYEEGEQVQNYQSLMFRESAVKGVVTFRQKMDDLSSMIVNYKTHGFTVGVDALSFSLTQWADAIQYHPQNAVLFSRILSTHDACVRQFYDPQQIINTIVTDMPGKKAFVPLIASIRKQKTGGDFEDWRKQRAMTILKSYGLVDENADKLEPANLRINDAMDLVGLVPEFSLVTAKSMAIGEPIRFNYHIHSPFGLSDTLGIRNQSDALEAYPLRISNVDDDVLQAWSEEYESNNTMGMGK